jgi:Raf kinase inhibitor-like YbhB/YbcL family protein
MSDMILASSVFEDGGRIPYKYAYRAENSNPPLSVEGVPESASVLALVIDDPDAQEATGRVFDHWVIWNVEAGRSRIPENWDVDAVEGENGIGETGFLGFNPPDSEHTYKFKLYALDSELDIEAGSSKEKLESAMDGKIIAKALLEGTFEPSQVPNEE